MPRVVPPRACTVAFAAALAALAVSTNAAAQTQPAPSAVPPPPPGFEKAPAAPAQPAPARSGQAAAQPAPQPAPAQPGPGYAAPQGYPQPQPAYPPGYAQPGYPPPGYYPQPGYYPGTPVYAVMSPQMMGPAKLDWAEGQPVPAGYRPITQVSKGMLIGGTVTLGSLWVLSLLTAAAVSGTSSAGEFSPLYVPVAGPFITMGTARSSGLGTVVLLIDGMGQSAGLALGIAGLVVKDTFLLRNDLAKQLTPVPMKVGERTMGMGWTGAL